MRRFRNVLAAAAALAAFAGVVVPAEPAQAASHCTTKGQKYFCDYGITTTKFPNGTKEEFVVGIDHAVWTNWTSTEGSWNGWVSMGGWVQSRIELDYLQNNPLSFTIAAIGGDDNYWFRMRRPDGSWTNWQVSCTVNPNGPGCP